MKLIGVRDGIRTVVGRLFPDDTVAELAEATEFYSDLPHWMGKASEADHRRPQATIDSVEQVPAVHRRRRECSAWG